MMHGWISSTTLQKRKRRARLMLKIMHWITCMCMKMEEGGLAVCLHHCGFCRRSWRYLIYSLTMLPAGKHYKLGKYYVAHKVLNLTTNCIFSHLLLRSWPLVVMWSWSIMIKKRMDLLMVYVSFKPLTWRLDSSIHPFLYILKTLENSFDIDLGNVKSTTHFCVFVIWFPRNCRHWSIFPENFLEKNTVRIPLKSWIVKDNVWDSFQFPL